MDSSTLIANILFIMFKVVPYFLPFLLAYIAWKSWMEYINTQHVRSIKWLTLQIVLPKEISKSPKAMELVLLNAFHQTGGTATWWAKYWQGKVRVHFSLEIVSIEGDVYFFIRTPSFYKNLIESQIYSQFPQVEIVEVDDYTNELPHDPSHAGWKLWGAEFKLAKDDVYPIKTYVDYGLDKPPLGSLPGYPAAPSNQIDPITPTIELLGSITKGQQIWMQYIIRASWDGYHKHGTWFGTESWAANAAGRVKAIKEKMKGKTDEKTPPKQLSKGEQDVISAIESNITNQSFDVGIRVIYMAEKDAYKPINVVGLVNTFKQYGSHDLNSFRPSFTTDYNYPWQDPWGKRERRNQMHILEAYREREFFYTPWSASFSVGHIHHHPFVLTTPELATIFHFPGRVSETPTFKRVDSKKGEPPQNLPI